MKQVSTSEMSIEEINRRIDQLRGEILGHFGISWTPLENAPATDTEKRGVRDALASAKLL